MNGLQNLDRVPTDMRSPVGDFARRLADLLGENLVSLAVYGSAAGPDYVPKRSNVNLVAVVRDLSFPVLRSLAPLITDRRRRGRIDPLFLTEDYLERSRDVFPIELAEMKERHLLLHGRDPLAGITVRAEHVRLECERELQGHLLKLRQAYLEIGDSPREVERLLHRALSSLIPIWRHLLSLRGAAMPPTREGVITALGEVFGADPGPFLAVHRDRLGDARLSGKEATAVLEAFLGELEKLTRAADEARTDRARCD